MSVIPQIHHEAKVEEEEREKQFVAQAMAGSMKYGGGGGGSGRDGRRGSNKPDDWQGGKGDRDRRDKGRDRDRDRKKPKEKLDARRLQVLLKQREKSKDSGAVSRASCTSFFYALSSLPFFCLQPPTLGPATFRPQGWSGRGGSGASSTTQDSAKTDKENEMSRYVLINTVCVYMSELNL